MTTVRTSPATPPPRLPVRDRAVAGRRTWGGASPMLGRLADERATGVLLRERGTLHLAEGRVVHAESPSSPGLDVLRAAGDALAEGALEICHLVALYDAAYFALSPSSTPGRFRYEAEPPPGSGHPVPVAAVEQETLRRRDLLDAIWPDPTMDADPLIRADPADAPRVTPRQRAVLTRVDGTRTATDIARELGRPAFHTLVDVRRLAAAGLVTTTPAEAPGDRLSVPAEPLPTQDPDIALLKRVRDALEAL
ncbi:transcriptional regulator [Streptomyces sp. NPDC051954]|uniref:transcriptional regulator n=1 Tax=unclassified Streptomyces TaxID=2593676 RepID=UPI003441B548